MKLSIIIPVYNVEKYISKCIDSIMNQKLSKDDYEVIIINDGSPDNSKNIILQYQEEFSNILFIDQINQGVSVARNKGLDIAKGEYVLFIDPDDSIHENSIGEILEVAIEKDLDILYLNLQVYDESDNFLYTYDKAGEENSIIEGIQHPRRTFPATLYKRSTIGKIRFFEGITRGQDTVFNAMVQSVSKRCSYSAIPYYKYLERETSSRQFVGDERAFNGCMIAIKEFENFKKKYFPVINKFELKYFNKVELLFLQRSLEWNIMPNLDKKRFYTIKEFLNDNELNELAKGISHQFKFFDKSYFLFYLYQSTSKKYFEILGQLSKVKRRFIN